MIIGIMGGMGPEATKDTFGKIISLTNASKDQDHVHIIVDNNTEIPDRTRFIMGVGENPIIEMVRSAIKLELMGADYIIIPCNTAHFFYDDIVKFTKSQILHMIRETVIFAQINFPGVSEFLLLSSIGTYTSGIYTKIFKESDLRIIEPTDTDKKNIMNWIYDIKAGIYVKRIEFISLINKYTIEKKIPVILGCTELSTLTGIFGLTDGYIDPVSVIAKRCIEVAKNSQRK